MADRKLPGDVSGAMAVLKKSFPDNAYASLCFAVVEQAVKDLFLVAVKDAVRTREYALMQRQARHYLSGDMFHCLACNVEPGYARLLLKKAGVRL